MIGKLPTRGSWWAMLRTRCVQVLLRDYPYPQGQPALQRASWPPRDLEVCSVRTHRLLRFSFGIDVSGQDRQHGEGKARLLGAMPHIVIT